MVLQFYTASLDTAEAWLRNGRRVLIWGPSGVGKSSFACRLAARLETASQQCIGISADPGSPVFGVPGALASARWRDGGWRVEALAALCALDAARYRLPLVQALSRLVAEIPTGPLVLDAPGLVRGLAARELLEGMVEVACIDAVLGIFPEQGALVEYAGEMLAVLGCEVLIAPPSPLAHGQSKKRRARERTLAWDAWLGQAEERELSLSRLRMSAPPVSEPEGWRGRQMALIDRSGKTLAMGEILSRDSERLRALLRQVAEGDADDALCLVRDAVRGPDGLLGTARPPGAVPALALVPPDLIVPDGEGADPACFVHLGAAGALLVNGLTGDPLLHLRLRQEARSLLFDLGDARRLPAKIVHQVTDVFISHAHMDHIGGFLWFLRSRIGVQGLCRLYGPPGLAEHVGSFIAGVRWDRIGDLGPRFEVLELHGERLHRFLLQVGLPMGEASDRLAPGGVLLEEPGLRVRAITLDHGIPVLAFAFEVPRTFRIRKDRLTASGLAGGPWLGRLERCLTSGELETRLALPDGRQATVSELAHELVEQRPGRSLVYATDLADSPVNRRLLIELARGADALVCEATFSQADKAHAERTSHLTAGACGEIAAQAGVVRLIPFHFSHRYESDPGVLYGEIEVVYQGSLIRSSKTLNHP